MIFNEVVIKYIKFNQSNKQTKQTYLNILKHHWIPALGNLPIESITTESILEVLIEKELSDKYTNQILIPLRGVFDTAIMLKYITDNPCNYIKNKKVQLELPDPFTRNELEIILEWLKEHTHSEYYSFYEFSFWTGLRPSEAIGLHRSDVNYDSIYVHRTRVYGVEKSTTKTKKVRQVLLNDRSKAVLDALPHNREYVFINPYTNKAFHNNVYLRQVFANCLRQTGIRKRPAYNTRHTYATLLLMSGVNPTFVANQLGHSLTILLDRYARWLHSDLDKQELQKLKTH